MTPRLQYGWLGLVFWGTAASAAAQPFVPRALTVTYVESEFRASDGVLISRNQKVFATRSDGSRVEPRSRIAPDGRVYDQKTILDVQKGKRIVVEGITESVITTPLSDREVQRLRTRDAG